VAAAPEQPEEVVDPDLPIVDPHHHLWGRERGWTPAVYLLEELLADTGSGHDVRATVFVEAGVAYRDFGPEEQRPVGETEFANAVAEEAAARGVSTRVAAGIVAHADLRLGAAVDEVLAQHREAAPDRLRGIRHMVSPELARGADLMDTEHMLLDPAFRKGLARLPAHALTFDVMALHFQLADVLDTVRALPEVGFVLDHVGGVVGIGQYAGRHDEVFAAWRTDLAALAREPNVVVKLGGMNMHLTGWGWHRRPRLPSSDELVAAQGRWFAAAIDSFGPDRCMFESNFPPDKISGSYRTLWNAFKKLAAGYSSEERSALFSGTATRVYRL
jgi:L-fuconolactonase